MMRCSNCGEIFANENLLQKSTYAVEAWGRNYNINTVICPGCKSNDLEPVEPCKICKKVVADDDITQGYCNECLKTLKKHIIKRYSQEQIDAILILYENGEL